MSPAVATLALAWGALLLVLPAVFLLIRAFRPWGRLAGQVAYSFRRNETLLAILLGQSAIQAYRLEDGFDRTELLLPLTVALVAVMLVWAFVARGEDGLERALPLVLWLSALICTRTGLRIAMGSIGPLEASWRGAAVITCFAVAFVVLAGVPLVMLSAKLATYVLGLIRRTTRPARCLFITGLATSVVLLAISQFKATPGVRLDLALRGSIVLWATSLAWLCLGSTGWSSKGTLMSGLRQAWDIPVWAYWAGIVGVGLGYLGLSTLVTFPGRINPDGLAYLTIARSIAEGHFVLRGYWSPLMPWLLAPAIALGADPYVAFQVLVRAGGLAWVLLGVALSVRGGLGRIERLALATVLALIAATRAFYPVTPDLLGAILLALYFLHVSSPSFGTRPFRDGALAAVLGAGAAFAKYYNFPYFLAHILLVSVVGLIWRKRDARVFRTLAVALVAFFMVTGPYAAALADRYGEPTFTTSGRISRATYGPTVQRHFPCWGMQLCPQPDDVLFPWEDPLGEYYPDLGWSPFQSLVNLRFQVLQVWTNATQWLSRTLTEVGPIPSIVVGALLIVWIPNASGSRSVPLPLAAFASVLLYASGYILTSTESFRFFLSTLPILWIGYFGLISHPRVSVLLHPSQAWAASLVRVLLLLLPVFSFPWAQPLRSSFVANDAKCIQENALRLAEPLEAPFAGTDDTVNHVAYYTRLRTIGVLPEGTAAPEADAQLRTLGVRSVLARSDLEITQGLLQSPGYHLAGEAEICGVSYSVLSVPR